MNENELKVAIEMARAYLQDIWKIKNHTDEEVLAAAEEFDRLINILILNKAK